MALLPTRDTFGQAASQVLAGLKKGAKEKQNEFVWVNQERFYAIAFIATGAAEVADELTTVAFKNAFAALKTLNVKTVQGTLWDWLSQFIVDVCGEYHGQYSPPTGADQQMNDPQSDGSGQMDWETTVILGMQRVKRCLGALPEEQQKVFILRHQLGLNYDQIATVLNQTPNNAMASLFRARVQIVKCLGRG